MVVHKDSITIAVRPATAKHPTRLERIPNDLPKLKRFLDRLGRDGELRVCYEVSGARYGDGEPVHGQLTEHPGARGLPPAETRGQPPHADGSVEVFAAFPGSDPNRGIDCGGCACLGEHALCH